MRIMDDPRLERNWRPLTRDPSESEIKQLCREIQSRWSPAEEQKRAGVYATEKWNAMRMSEEELVG